MAEKFPVDEFDRVTAVGGRHRGLVSRGSRVLKTVTSLSIAVVLGAAGYYGLDFASQLAQQPGEQVVASSYLADGASVTVLDASGRKQLATKLAAKLADANWNVLTAADQIDEADPTLTQPKTVIFASTDAALAAAKTLVKSVGNFEVRQSSTYPDDITVVLGTDF